MRPIAAALPLLAAALLPALAPSPAAAQTRYRAEFCYDQRGAYVTDIVSLGKHGDGFEHLINDRAIPVGKGRCITTEVHPTRPTYLDFVGTAFTGFNTVQACRLRIDLPRNRNSRFTVTLRGTTFHPNCTMSEG